MFPQSWDQTFLSLSMRLNSLIMHLFEFWSHDRFISHKNDHEIKIRNNACLGFDLMIKVSIDLLINIIRQIWPHEQIQFWPHDHNFDLMKNGNFNLMKFDLMIIAQNIQVNKRQDVANTVLEHFGSSWNWQY